MTTFIGEMTTNSGEITTPQQSIVVHNNEDILRIPPRALPEVIRDMFPKADGASHVERPLTGTHYVLYNALYANAYDALLETDIHRVSQSAIFHATRYTINNETKLYEHLNALLTTQHRWNIFNKDKQTDWGASTLISSYNINFERKDLEYSFSPYLRSLLRGKPYTTMSILPKHSEYSKYSHILSELLRTYFRERHGEGETPWVSVEELRAYMGIQENEYERFANLKIRVIEQPLLSLSDELPFTVEVQYRRHRTMVTAIKFLMKRKTGGAAQQQSKKPPRGQRSLGDGASAGETTFDKLPVGARYKIRGGSGAVCIKLGEKEAAILRENGRKEPVVMANLSVAVILV